MPLALSNQQTLGRVVEAARVLCGMDQASLAALAGVAPATVSNVENGKDAREETVRALRRALRQSGVSILLDKSNGYVSVGISFHEPDDDDE